MSQSDDAARINEARACLSVGAWDGVLFWSLCEHGASWWHLGDTVSISIMIA